MADSTEKPPCKYGDQCYQRNEAHKSRFWHPAKDSGECNVDKKRSPERSPEKQPRIKRTRHSSDDETGTSNQNEPAAAESRQPVVEEDKPTNNSPAENKAHNSHSGNEQLNGNALSAQLEIIRSHFSLEMPEDALLLWDYCEKHGTAHDPNRTFDKLGMQLVGPFDVLAGHFDEYDAYEAGDHLTHWRFYYDPPEFQTVFVKAGSGIHYGIWRDDPMSTNAFIARNDASKGCEITIVADNIFGAILHYLDKDVQQTMFNQRELSTHKRSLTNYAQQHNLRLDSLHTKLKARNARSVCKTFHRAGLVVPFDRKTEVGYRPLIETDANLKKILQKFSDADGDEKLLASAFDALEPLITAANIACDESDFGNAIELGLDLFSFGTPELHSAAQRLLQTGYSMVKKPQFGAIVAAHLKNRRKHSTNLSIISPNKNKDATS